MVGNVDAYVHETDNGVEFNTHVEEIGGLHSVTQAPEEIVETPQSRKWRKKKAISSIEALAQGLGDITQVLSEYATDW
ncbi:unnamed protein product, partial [Ilex paraguariensis]